MTIFTFSSLVLTVFLRININLSDAIAQAVPEETNRFAPSNKLKSRKKITISKCWHWVFWAFWILMKDVVFWYEYFDWNMLAVTCLSNPIIPSIDLSVSYKCTLRLFCAFRLFIIFLTDQESSSGSLQFTNTMNAISRHRLLLIILSHSPSISD